MIIRKKVAYSIVVALIIFFISMFADIVPCQTAPSVPNPEYSWKFCNINPDSSSPIGIQKKYLGYSTSLAETYIIVLFLSFIIAMIVLQLATKTRKQN